MIKHGKIYPFKKRAPTHLEPIKDFITKGIADAKEGLVLHPKKCDIKGAKRFNSQHCVLARTINREYQPDAVAVGRAVTYLVYDGVAIKFSNPQTTTGYVEVFDEHGVAAVIPVRLYPIHKSRCLHRQQKQRPGAHPRVGKTRRPPAKRVGVRAIGGGITKRAA